MNKRYSACGFIFNKTLTKVLLIHKLAPVWMLGKINGIGGKLEINETSLDCIVREVAEETGIKTVQDKWTYSGCNDGSTWHVDFYGYIYTGKLFPATTYEKEKIEWFDIYNLPANIMPNLTWLIPLTLDKLTANEYKMFEVNYA
jgi:8-oxo-dGTP diphosphatase